MTATADSGRVESIGHVVADLGRPSGGVAYHDEVGSAWPAVGPAPARIDIAWPGRQVAAALASAVMAHRVCLVDGLLAAEHPDVVEAAVARGHRVVVVVHLPRPEDEGVVSTERERLASLEARTVQAASAVVVPSAWAAADLAARYGRQDLVVARPGVRPAPVADVHSPPVVLQLGAIGPLKNQLLTVQALEQCPDLDLRVRLVGPVIDEGYASRVRTLIDRLPLGRVSLEPPVAGADRDSVLAGADLILSVATRETYGLTVVEGLARGIPGVVGRGTGAEEALAAGGGSPGRPVATDDIAELASALAEFVTVPVTRQAWRAAAVAARSRLPGWSQTAEVIARLCASG